MCVYMVSHLLVLDIYRGIYRGKKTLRTNWLWCCSAKYWVYGQCWSVNAGKGDRHLKFCGQTRTILEPITGQILHVRHLSVVHFDILSLALSLQSQTFSDYWWETTRKKQKKVWSRFLGRTIENWLIWNYFSYSVPNPIGLHNVSLRCHKLL